MTLAVATDLGMSAGKTLAQVGHASLLAGLEVESDRGLEIHVVGAAAKTWAAHAPDAVAIVRDGGLTEIAAGSETVLVLWQRAPVGERMSR